MIGGRLRQPPAAAAAAPAHRAELHEAAVGAGIAEGTASLSSAGALQWLRRLRGPPGRCWPRAGRAEPGCGQQGLGSRLEAAAQPRKLRSTALGGSAPCDYPSAGSGGCAAAAGTPGRARGGLKGQLPARRGRLPAGGKGSEAPASWEEGVGPSAGDPRAEARNCPAPGEPGPPRRRRATQV